VIVLCLDADRFTQINDTWGHPAGDELLCAFADRLLATVRAGGATFRTSGDEFAVVITGRDPGAGPALAAQIMAAGREALFLSGDRKVELTATIGVAHARPGEITPTELLRNADTALYRAKQDGRASLTVFDESLRTQVYDRLMLAVDLRAAVAEGLIEAHFQPIHGGPGFGELIGFEALARWNDPLRGPISPAVFVPLAEDTGSIIEIGEFMLRRACRQLAEWRRLTGADLHVSVNVSQVQIMRSDVAATVASALSDSGLPAEAVWLEITESLLAERDEVVLGTLRRLKELGVTLALDDFGTGYSSLSCIGDFPIDVVKVDRSFVMRLGQDARTTALTQVIIDMVRSLGLTGVVAEGVETAEQAELLERMGCTWGQGWLFGRPQPSSQVVLGHGVDHGLGRVPTDVPSRGSR
jgi:diguanylate cyclase (GGDEF)-like protein